MASRFVDASAFPRLNRFWITPCALLLVVTLTQPLLDGGFGCISVRRGRMEIQNIIMVHYLRFVESYEKIMG